MVVTMSAISQLPQLEQDAIALLLHGKGVPRDLVAQTSRVASVVRDETSAGVYVDFVLTTGAVPLEGRRNFHIADLSAVAGDSKELEFILYVRKGFIACLEVYSVFDVLPSYESALAGFSGVPKVYE